MDDQCVYKPKDYDPKIENIYGGQFNVSPFLVTLSTHQHIHTLSCLLDGSVIF